MYQHKHSLRRAIESRIRFYPTISAAISGADEVYERKIITEAQLKALAIASSGGTQWACGSCGEQKKQTVVTAGVAGVTEEELRASLIFKFDSGGKRELKIRYLPQLKAKVDSLIEEGFVQAKHRVLYSSAFGYWSVPGLDLGCFDKDFFWYPTLSKYIMEVDRQALFVARWCDTAMENQVASFSQLAMKWANYIRLDNPGMFAFQAEGVLGRLISAGHAEEV